MTIREITSRSGEGREGNGRSSENIAGSLHFQQDPNDPQKWIITNEGGTTDGGEVSWKSLWIIGRAWEYCENERLIVNAPRRICLSQMAHEEMDPGSPGDPSDYEANSSRTFEQEQRPKAKPNWTGEMGSEVHFPFTSWLHFNKKNRGKIVCSF